MYEFHTVQSNRNYSEKPQDSNNKNIRINGFVTVSPQVFIIENRIKATGPSVSCNTPFCRETWWGLAWAGSGWTVTKFPASLQQRLLPRGTSRAPCGFGMLSKDVKAKTIGAKSTGHYILYTASSTAGTVTVSAKPPVSPNSVTKRLQNQPHRDGNTGPVLSPYVPQEDLVLKQNSKFSFKPLNLCTGTWNTSRRELDFDVSISLSFWSPSQVVKQAMTHASPLRTPGGPSITYLSSKHPHTPKADLVI